MGKPKKRDGQDQEEPTADKTPGQPLHSASLSTTTQQETTLDTILQAIRESREALKQKIDNLTVDLSLLRDDHRKLTERVGATEKTLNAVTSTQKTLTLETSDLISRIKTLESRAEDAENRSWRSNLRIIGMPEGMELSESNTETFLENWLKDTGPPEGFSAFFVIERAH
ncbi:uncharacterized protein [Pleurodeles waltl]|uniref:uncharacterized protein n=1 Tax=Pleurodeles waltl TaxID=8319 RepID=UPI00370973D7